MISLGRVIEDNIQNHLDPRSMKGLHHVAKFVDRSQGILTGAVGRMWSEEGNRRVAPIVDDSRWAVLWIVGEDGQQLDRIDSEFLKVRNFLDQPCVRAAGIFCDAGIWIPREASNVHFVDDGLRRRASKRRISSPVVRVSVNNDTLHRHGRIVTASLCRVARITVWNHDAAAIRIKQYLLTVKSQALGRIIRSLYAVRIDMSGPHVGNKHVPVMVSAVHNPVEGNNTGRMCVINMVEQQQFDIRCRS